MSLKITFDKTVGGDLGLFFYTEQKLHMFTAVYLF